MTPEQILTIGHSLLQPGQFLELLRANSIDTVVDVRSTPYSRRNPPFGREILKEGLRRNLIDYLFMGEVLGGRGDRSVPLSEDGQVSYRGLAASTSFRGGLDRLEAGSRSFRLALMCSEGDPIRCHRGLLIARELKGRGLRVGHIQPGKPNESQDDLEQRLLAATGLAQRDELYRAPREAIEEAYETQSTRVAWRDPDVESMESA